MAARRHRPKQKLGRPEDSCSNHIGRTPSLCRIFRLRSWKTAFHSGGWQCSAAGEDMPRAPFRAGNEGVQACGTSRHLPQKLSQRCHRRADFRYSLRRQARAQKQQPLLDFEAGEDEDESSSGESVSGEEAPLKVLMRAQRKLRVSSTGKGRTDSAETLGKGKKGRKEALPTTLKEHRPQEGRGPHGPADSSASSGGNGDCFEPDDRRSFEGPGHSQDATEDLAKKMEPVRLGLKRQAPARKPETAAARAFRQYHESKRRMFKRPLKHVKPHLKEAEEQLGGGDDIPYRLVDYTRKIHWRDSRSRGRRSVRQGPGRSGEGLAKPASSKERPQRKRTIRTRTKPARESQREHRRAAAQPVRATRNLLELIGTSSGSFGRFWREYISVSSRLRADPSVPKATECTKIFRSILHGHWTAGLTQPARSGRTRQRRRGRAQALIWTQQLWCLFNFFECGSPASAEAVSAAVHRGRETPWSTVHQSHATNLFKEVIAFCRQPKPDLGCRGVAKLSDLIRRIRNLQYDTCSSGDLDGLASQAKTLDPARVSVPSKGGIW